MSFVRRWRTGSLSDAEVHDATERVMAVARFIYGCCKQAPGLATLDEKAMWRVMYEAFDDDMKGKRLFADLKDTAIWARAVTTAKWMYEMYAAPRD